MHRAEGSGVRPHAEVAKVLCIAAKLRTPATQGSENPLSPYRVDILEARGRYAPHPAARC